MTKWYQHVLAAVALSALAASTAWGGTITLRADEWCPYNCEAGSDTPGYMVEAATEIFAAIGDKVDYQTLNWARAIDETREGKFNAIIGAAISDAEDFIFPSESFGLSANGYCTRKGVTFTYDSEEPFKDLVLAVIRDYSYDDEMVDGYVEAHKDDPAKVQIASGDNALDINLKKLAKGRVGVVVDDYSVLRKAVKEMGIGSEVQCVSDDEPTPIYIAFSPKDPASKKYAAQFDKGISELRKQGKLQKIMESYGLDDWK